MVLHTNAVQTVGTVAKAVSRQSCADVSLTVAMVLRANAVQMYRTVAKSLHAKAVQMYRWQ